MLFDGAFNGIGGVMGTGVRPPRRLARFGGCLVQPIADRIDRRVHLVRSNVLTVIAKDSPKQPGNSN